MDTLNMRVLNGCTAAPLDQPGRLFSAFAHAHRKPKLQIGTFPLCQKCSRGTWSSTSLGLTFADESRGMGDVY